MLDADSGIAATAGDATGDRRAVLLSLGADRFLCDFEHAAAPRACAVLEAMLPITARASQARWSGASLWAPLGLDPCDVPAESLIETPGPGEMLLYGGGISEPEILIPYGPSRFSSVLGPLRGAHVLTVRGDLSRLTATALDIIAHGARPLRLKIASPIDLPLT